MSISASVPSQDEQDPGQYTFATPQELHLLRAIEHRIPFESLTDNLWFYAQHAAERRRSWLSLITGRAADVLAVHLNALGMWLNQHKLTRKR